MITSIYFSDPKLREDAKILARLNGQSLSELVCEVLRARVDETRDEIDQMKAIKEKYAKARVH